MPEGIITIRKGREKPIRNQHPWVFSGSVASAKDAANGEIVTVVDQRSDFLARGYWNSQSSIQVRLMTWQDEPIDDAWWQQKLEQAIAARPRHSHLTTEEKQPLGIRLVNAENDFLPGLVVDRYADWLVLQALTLHIDQRKNEIAAMLGEMLDVRGVYERSDVDVREKEGLSQATGVLWGEAPPERIVIKEAGSFYVDVYNGHKTGFYLDQYDNRRILHDLINEHDGECHLLNAFGYTGGFAIAAAEMGGVHAVTVDSSEDALAIAQENWSLNEYDERGNARSAEFVQADVFDYLREDDDQFDIIVLDPPKFAHNKRQVKSAARGYKDINLNAFKRVKPGGYLMTFSCSGAVDRDLFQKIVFGALADSGRQAQIVRHLGAADDHPIALTFPEGEYLKGLLLRVY